MNLDLKDKVIIITGSGSGIGRSLTKVFAEHGCKVVITDVSLEKALETKEIVDRFGGSSIALRCDVSNEQNVMDMVDEAVSHFNTIDILINSAGIFSKHPLPVIELSVEEWDSIMNINLKGTFLCSKHVGKVLCEKREGVIINIASIAAKTPRMNLSAYSTSKAAIAQLTKITALEMAEYNVRVNALCPGATVTPMYEAARLSGNMSNGLEDIISASISGDIKTFRSAIPLKRVAELEDQVNAALFLTSPMARHITGQLLFVDGEESII